MLFGTQPWVRFELAIWNPCALLGGTPRSREMNPPTDHCGDRLAPNSISFVGAARIVGRKLKKYHCVILARDDLLVRVDFTPAYIREDVKNICGKSEYINTPYCEFNIRFVFMKNEYTLSLGALPLLSIIPKRDTGILSEPRRRLVDKENGISGPRADCFDPNTYENPLT